VFIVCILFACLASGFVKQGGSSYEARLEQTPYPFQTH